MAHLHLHLLNMVWTSFLTSYSTPMPLKHVSYRKHPSRSIDTIMGLSLHIALGKDLVIYIFIIAVEFISKTDNFLEQCQSNTSTQPPSTRMQDQHVPRIRHGKRKTTYIRTSTLIYIHNWASNQGLIVTLGVIKLLTEGSIPHPWSVLRMTTIPLFMVTPERLFFSKNL